MLIIADTYIIWTSMKLSNGALVCGNLTKEVFADMRIANAGNCWFQYGTAPKVRVLPFGSDRIDADYYDFAQSAVERITSWWPMRYRANWHHPKERFLRCGGKRLPWRLAWGLPGLRGAAHYWISPHLYAKGKKNDDICLSRLAMKVILKFSFQSGSELRP